MDDEEEKDFNILDDGNLLIDDEEEDPLKMDGFHEEGAETETDF